MEQLEKNGMGQRNKPHRAVIPETRPSVNASGISETILVMASEAILAIGHGGIALDDWLDQNGDASGERRALSSLLFTYFRKKAALDRALAGCWQRAPQEKLAALLSAALTLAHYQTALHPASAINVAVDVAKKRFGAGAGRFANAVLRRALRLLEEYEPTALELLPEALRKRWGKRFGMDKAVQFAALFQAQSPVSVRVRNGFRLPADAAAMDLTFASPWQFFTPVVCSEVLASQEFQQGAYYLQDPAPAAVIAALQPFLARLPETPEVLDLCAAPGGKLLMLAELLQSAGKAPHFTALDRSVRRQKYTAQNLARCGVEANIVTGDAALWMPEDNRKFDLVTADVPCSNSGVFRRRPDALWRWRAADLSAITRIQSAILEHASELAKPCGMILYSTCSLEDEENSGVVERFLRRHLDWQLFSSVLLTPDDGHDGTFAAILCRKEMK